MERSNSGLGANRPSMTQHAINNSAPALLREAANVIEERAAERDLTRERSMKRAVAAFNTLTGSELSEVEGWLFMSVLKLSRATAGTFQSDDLHDCAAYVALALECAINEPDEVRLPPGMKDFDRPYHQAEVYGEKTP